MIYFSNFDVAAAGGTPTFRSATTTGGSSTGTLALASPTGAVTGDLILVIVETNGDTVSAPAYTSGGAFTEASFSPINGTGTRMTIFYRFLDGTESGTINFADPGNHIVARAIAIEDANPTTPFDVQASATFATEPFNCPTVTTTVDNCLIVLAFVEAADFAGLAVSSWTNANLTGLTERTIQSASAGDGGGLAIATGTLAAAGATGTTAVDLANSAYVPGVALTLAIKG